MQVIGERVYLRPLSAEDVTNEYVDWLADEEVNQFLESRWRKYTLNDIRAYVQEINNSSSDFLFGIHLIENDEHIGNIKIGAIDQIHKFGEVGLFIGNKSVWGKGYASESIKLATKYAFEQINLNKLFAGMYGDNVSCLKAFLKTGYRQVGKLEKHRLYKGSFVDQIIVEKCR